MTAVAGWSLPSIALVLIPKCPLCVMAYGAAIGISVSESAATGVRAFLIVGCTLAIALSLSAVVSGLLRPVALRSFRKR